jgi:hypothetical protein
MSVLSCRPDLLAIAGLMAYMPLIRTIDLLVERAEPALLPKTSLKSDQACAKVVQAQRACAQSWRS